MQRKFIDLGTLRNLDQLRGSGIRPASSDAVRVDLQECILLYIGGKAGIDPQGKIVGPTMREQAQRAFDRIRHIVESEGGQIDDIVRIRIFVSQADAVSFRAIHSVRGAMWPAGKFPASTLVLTGIAVDGGLIEVDADAVIPRNRSYEATASADRKRQ